MSTILSGQTRLLHGGDYNPDQWLRYPEILDEDLRLMQLSGCNTFSIGIFAWTSYERTEGQYDFSWLERLLDRMAEAGHNVLLATPTAAKPAWLAKKYPEVRRVDHRGRREPHGGRHNHCWSSPVFRDKTRAINGELARRFGAHPAVKAWHISNEYSGNCYCDGCLAAFHAWLEKRYGDIETLNDVWWTAFWSHTYSEFGEIDPRDYSIDAMKLDFRRFNTDQVIDFIRFELAAVREFCPDKPATVNLMGLCNPLDYSRIVQEVDFVADDQYPSYNPEDPELERKVLEFSFKDDAHRCWKPDKAWMLMESCPEATNWRTPARLKAPGLHHAEMIQALGHGAEGTCYFQWRKNRAGGEKFHGAVVDHVGHEHTRTFEMITSLSRKYERLTGILGSRMESQVAVIFDWEARWAFEASEGVRSRDEAYADVAMRHYAPFRRLGASVDVIGSDRDFSKYRVLVAPQLWMLKPGLAKRLEAFVQNGGQLVGTYYTGVVDETNRCFLGGFPGDGLRQLFGVWNEELDWLSEGMTRRLALTEAAAQHGLGGEHAAREVCGLVHLEGATPLALYDEAFYRATPALTYHAVGRGGAYYHAAALGEELLQQLTTRLVEQTGIARAVPEPLPRGVQVQRRATAERAFLFFENFSGVRVELTLPTGAERDLIRDATLGPSLVLEPWDSTVIEQRFT